MKVCHDERGPHLVVPFELADEVRARLVALGLPFEEDEEASAGCAGPVWSVLRLEARSLSAFGGSRRLEARL